MAEEYHEVERQHCESMMVKMWYLQSKGQHSDVVIKVDEKVFHCHRIILSASSEYFCRIFQENSNPEVTLVGVDQNTVETILRFIYTGDIEVNPSNVICLIDNAAFYGLGSLEEHLIAFARNSSTALSSEDILKMFTAAHTKKMENLFQYLGEYIYSDFGFFSDSPEFINLTWASLMNLAEQASSKVAGRMGMLDTFVEGVLKWIRGQVNAIAGEGGSYFEQFVKIVHQTESFTCCIRHILDRFRNIEQAPSRHLSVAALDERPPKLLRAFVERPVFPYEFDATILSMFTLHETNAGLAWAHSGTLKSASRYMKNLVIDDSLFTLTPDFINEAGATFIRRTGAPHISWNQCQDLKRPPYLTANFEMCGTNNNIFAYNKIVTVGRRDFTDEELLRGLIHYRRDVDKWFPVPSPPRKYRMACITCDERLVYLIGGTNSEGAVQAYDLRAPNWINLRSTTGTYEDAACCIRDGKIWVVGGEGNPTAVEIFDPIAGTWERGKDLIDTRPGNNRLVNWDSVRYGPTVVSFRNSSYTDHRILFADDSLTSGWNMIPDLELAFQESRVTQGTNDRIVDMVVF